MLKILGRTPTVLRESRQAPGAAREIQFTCGLCKKNAYAMLPYAPTSGQRQQIIKAALDEHRRVCTAAPPEVQRTYEIWYPRA